MLSFRHRQTTDITRTGEPAQTNGPAPKGPGRYRRRSGGEAHPTPADRPATGQTPKRYLRMGALWDQAAELARQRGETTTALITRAVEREVRRLRREAERP